MRILIVSHSYAPELTPRAFRWAAIAQYLVQHGHKVDIVCARPRGSPEHELLEGVEVRRVRDHLSRTPVAPSVEAGGRSKILNRLARWAYARTWRRLYWPDYACGWYFPAVRAASAWLAEREYDWFISVSHPFTGHLVGLTLKRRYPRVQWLADVGDPFCLMDDPAPNNRVLYRRLSWVADRAVLREADAVAVTTKGTRDAYTCLFPEVAAKLHVIPPLLSLTAEMAPGLTRPHDGTFRLVYVGTLYRRLRSPAPLLDLFKRLIAALPNKQMELHILGSVNDCRDLLTLYEPWLGTRIFVHGLVSRERAREAMEGADVLINLGNRSATQLPSKVIEYVAMGKPILNLVTIKEDSSAEILGSYPAALTLQVVDEVIPEAEMWEAAGFIANPPKVTAEMVSDWLAPYSLERVSQDYLGVLSSAGAGSGLMRGPKVCQQSALGF